MSKTLVLPRQQRGVPRPDVKRGELRVNSLLGTEAVYRVLDRSGEHVDVEVLRVPGLVRKRGLRLATTAVQPMASVRSPAELVAPLDATRPQPGCVPAAAPPQAARSAHDAIPAQASAALTVGAASERWPATGLRAHVALALRRLTHLMFRSAGGR